MLTYLAFGLIAAAVSLVAKIAYPISDPAHVILWFGLVLLIERLAGHTSRGRALRPVTSSLADVDGGPSGEDDNAVRWYIESTPDAGGLPHSCSFVEFDERGDYLDFEQHRRAYQKILALAANEMPLTVVIYVHGWRHSGQSGDVVAFNEFLHQLAEARDERGRVRRVHGVYLAWRGGLLKHVINKDKTFEAVARYYGGSEVIDSRNRAPVPLLNLLLESLSYWDRKSVPEHKFSGTALSRTVFSCAYAAKRSTGDRQVLLMGHSFGGLMLERTFQNAAIGQLAEAWPWGEPNEAGKHVNPLPFDTVLLVNSAAPSIYAKQFQSYLAAHRQAMASAHVPHANTPFMFSLTSSADWATGVVHPVANVLSFLVPTLWRNYRGDDFVLERLPVNRDVVIPQAYYYRHTPGHNPLLVNRFVEPLKNGTNDAVGGTQVARNLARRGDAGNVFSTSPTKAGLATQQWVVSFPPTTADCENFSTYEGRRPVAWTVIDGKYAFRESAYWIVRCPKAIIAGHNDIWSQPAMETYAALHSLALEGNAP